MYFNGKDRETINIVQELTQVQYGRLLGTLDSLEDSTNLRVMVTSMQCSIEYHRRCSPYRSHRTVRFETISTYEYCWTDFTAMLFRNHRYVLAVIESTLDVPYIRFRDGEQLLKPILTYIPDSIFRQLAYKVVDTIDRDLWPAIWVPVMYWIPAVTFDDDGNVQVVSATEGTDEYPTLGVTV